MLHPDRYAISSSGEDVAIYSVSLPDFTSQIRTFISRARLIYARVVSRRHFNSSVLLGNIIPFNLSNIAQFYSVIHSFAHTTFITCFRVTNQQHLVFFTVSSTVSHSSNRSAFSENAYYTHFLIGGWPPCQCPGEPILVLTTRDNHRRQSSDHYDTLRWTLANLLHQPPNSPLPDQWS
jgi:hypothetical protein